MIRGFLACRKHADRIILLVEMMQGCGCPAFKGGHRALQALRKRFHLNLPEPQVGSCNKAVTSLVKAASQIVVALQGHAQILLHLWATCSNLLARPSYPTPRVLG